MKSRKVFVLVAIFAFLSIGLQAQPRKKGYFSVGVSAGAMHYVGDLTPSRFDALRFTRPAVGIMGSYRFDPFVTGRLSITRGSIAADDLKVGLEESRVRGLNFRSPITELSGVLIFDLIPTERSYTRRPKATPYAFIGLSVFAFNPKTDLDGQTYELKPLGTEGQYLPDPDNLYSEPYKLAQFSIPFGVGFRFSLGPSWDLHIEGGLRKTFTDYIDDVSTIYPNLTELREHNPTAFLLSDRSDRNIYPEGRAPGSARGNPGGKDWYSYTNITLSYIIDVVKCPRF